MFARKPISHDSLPAALNKAERYRLLNEPAEAESICRDILEIEPRNQQALINLVLALTDQIAEEPRAFSEALAVTNRLESAYDRAYYAGIAWERRAKSRHRRGRGVQANVYEWLVNALRLFEEAERLRAPGSDDAILRWNACVRYLARHRDLTPAHEEFDAAIASE
jgi:hypothetical protein